MSLGFDPRDRESVLRDLRDLDEEVRRLAVERVSALGADEAVERLVECLGDPSWRVRKAAVERLVAHAASEGVADALMAALADGENPGRRNAAVEALIHCGAGVVPRLVAERDNPDADVRKLVVDVLSGIADPVARQPLLDWIDDPDPNVRAAVVDALGALGGPGVVDVLKRAVLAADEDALVRFSAIHALIALDLPIRAGELRDVLDDPMLGPAALGLLGRSGDDPTSRAALLEALASDVRPRREAAMRPLLRMLATLEDEGARSLRAAVREAAARSADLVPDAIDRLEGGDLSQRLVLVQFLGLLGTPETIVPVLRAGCDEALAEVSWRALEAAGAVAEDAIDAAWSSLDPPARRDACRVFGATNGPRGAERLLCALDDPASEVRAAAAASIGRRGLASGLPALVRRLVDAARDDDDYENEAEQAAVSDALVAVAAGSDGGASIVGRAVELLAATLEGADEDVRLAVAEVMGRIGRPEDAPIVSFLSRDPSERVRRAAVVALAGIDPDAASESLRLALADEAPAVRIAAARAIGESGSERVLEDLQRLADDDDARVRAAAVRSIVGRYAGAVGADDRAISGRVLDSALVDVAPVTLAALEVLAVVGGDVAARAVELLSRPEPEIVREAIRCAGRHADVDELDALLPLVSHADWSVRAEAIQVLADRGVRKGVPAILGRLDTEQDDFVRAVTLRALERLESGV